MPKINSLMDIGKRSMMNSQTALQTVGHNISNKTTEGYSRQRVEIQSNPAVGGGKKRVGTGARVVGVTRTNNPFLERQIGNERSTQGFLDGKSDSLNRVEQVYNEQLVDGLNSSVSDFFNSFRELANNPENLATRQLVVERSDVMASDFNRVRHQLRDIQSDLDQQVELAVTEINQYAKEIASLNEKIQTVELTGADANDERDRRDLLIKKLGELGNIKWAEGKDSQVAITLGNVAVLVAGREHRPIDFASTPRDGNKLEGNYDVIYHGDNKSNPTTITNFIKGGKAGAIIEVRDQIVTGLIEDLDEMAYTIANEVNTLHRAGYDGNFQRGQNFFNSVEKDQAAELLKMNTSVREDVTKIAVAGQPGSPGDNRVANLISDLQYKKTMRDGSATFDDFHNKTVASLGVITQSTHREQEAQTNIVNQLSNIRESISGVSIDEETTQMIKFQKAFDASARLIRAADEMMDTVINLKRY